MVKVSKARHLKLNITNKNRCSHHWGGSEGPVMNSYFGEGGESDKLLGNSIPGIENEAVLEDR